MALFGLFGNKKKEKKQDKNHDILSSEGLIDFVKSNLDDPSDENVLKAVQAIAKPADDLEHLDQDGELPWGWYSKNEPIYKLYENKIVQLAVDLKPLKGYERIAQLENLIASYYEYKEFCYRQNECFQKYFSDTWEHCFNSRYDDFEYITPYIKELAQLKSSEATLNKEHERRMVALDNLDERILDALCEHDGILQSDFVKLFDYTVHAEVRDKLYHMTQEGHLERVKSGRSYILHIKKT